MSTEMKSENRRWTAKRKSALVLDIFKSKTTVSEASRTYDLSPSEIEGWIEEATEGMENALRVKPHDIREQYERKVKDLQESYGEAMLEIRARKKLQSLLDEEEK
ncbi:transposase [Oligella urethralis]|uniref:transposase n=1 Tax=Oligella urethralis TaxID=90245 RepID=UPI000C9CC108|nr:transposase [Oligella urethralis]PMC13657.1 transposase [Oligella urethralis]